MINQLVQSLGGPRAILVNSAMGSVLFGLSDILAQELEQQNESESSTTTSNGALSQKKTTVLDNLLQMNPSSLVSSFSTQESSSATANQPQHLLEAFHDADLDHTRLRAAIGMGVLCTAAIYPYAYARLDAWIVGQHWRAVIQKSLVEVATVGIFVNSLSMLGRGWLTGRHSLEESCQHVQQELPQVTINDARVWIPYNMVAFGCLPLAVRPITTSCMEAAWQTYISLRSNDYDDHEQEETVQSASTVLSL